jgi:lipopolysaccharide/colanic/teichoic acid biosynthesis glycosyltransferase
VRASKRIFDLFWTLPGIVLLLVPGLAIAAAVVIEDGWPPLYAQERVGLHGQPFKLLKFRSMRSDCDRTAGHLTIGDDSRITRIGRVLREAKLDELPQLLNVLHGDMSLVGPRPEVPEYVEQYTTEQREVLELTPGITDPASLKYADESRTLALQCDPHEYYVMKIVPDKIRISLQYAEQATIISDFVVMIETVFGRGRGSRGSDDV